MFFLVHPSLNGTLEALQSWILSAIYPLLIFGIFIAASVIGWFNEKLAGFMHTALAICTLIFLMITAPHNESPAGNDISALIFAVPILISGLLFIYNSETFKRKKVESGKLLTYTSR